VQAINLGTACPASAVLSNSAMTEHVVLNLAGWRRTGTTHDTGFTNAHRDHFWGGETHSHESHSAGGTGQKTGGLTDRHWKNGFCPVCQPVQAGCVSYFGRYADSEEKSDSKRLFSCDTCGDAQKLQQLSG
jgi:hypothetical protein